MIAQIPLRPDITQFKASNWSQRAMKPTTTMTKTRIPVALLHYNETAIIVPARLLR